MPTRLLSRLVGIAFLVTAVLKAIGPDRAWEASRVLTGSTWTATIVVVGAVSVAAAIGLGLVVGTASRGWLLAAMVLIGVLSLVLAWLLWAAPGVSCGCAGVIRLFESAEGEARFGIGRNLVLFGLAAGAWPKREVAERESIGPPARLP